MPDPERSPNAAAVTVPVIVGPTASGKTALATALADRLERVEIISADSRQIYVGMDIGTAKPAADVLAVIPHHLVDIIHPDEAYSAGRFARDAVRAIAEIRERGNLPLVVGGTGFYVQALFSGLDAPAVDQAVYDELVARAEREGYEALLEELRRVDPAAAAAHPPENRVKTLRALACYHQTGRAYSSFLEEMERGGGDLQSLRAGVLLLMPDRDLLYDRINRRAAEMVEDGLLDETEELLRKGYGPDDPGLKTVGYKEALQHIRGERTRDEMLDAIRQSTRRYAKRQMTWFRHRAGDAFFMGEPDVERAIELLAGLGAL